VKERHALVEAIEHQRHNPELTQEEKLECQKIMESDVFRKDLNEVKKKQQEADKQRRES
jgi:hypothetical protein